MSMSRRLNVPCCRLVTRRVRRRQSTTAIGSAKQCRALSRGIASSSTSGYTWFQWLSSHWDATLSVSENAGTPSVLRTAVPRQASTRKSLLLPSVSSAFSRMFTHSGESAGFGTHLSVLSFLSGSASSGLACPNRRNASKDAKANGSVSSRLAPQGCSSEMGRSSCSHRPFITQLTLDRAADPRLKHRPREHAGSRSRRPPLQEEAAFY